MVESIELDAETFRKKVIVDMGRETVITGGDIPINPVTIARGSFSIRISKTGLSDAGWKDSSQNPGVDIGDNVKIGDKPVINIDNAMVNTKGAPTVSDLVRAMKVMKLPMSEIIDTLKMIKEMGAIDAEIEIRG
jgi:flagellar P-ring protein precursor FlgI